MGMSDEGLSRPRPLAADHDTDNFDCGSPELNGWLKDWAFENHRSGNCRVFVVAKDRRVVGFYALTSASVERELAPPDIKKGGVPRALPCILLARLAVDLTEQGRGLGRAILADSVMRSIGVAEHVGARALLVHAQDPAARDFYLHLAEFVSSPQDPLKLFIHMKHAQRLIESG